MTHSAHLSIDHFTVVCLVDWPFNESEAGVELILIETLLHIMYVPPNLHESSIINIDTGRFPSKL